MDKMTRVFKRGSPTAYIALSIGLVAFLMTGVASRFHQDQNEMRVQLIIFLAGVLMYFFGFKGKIHSRQRKLPESFTRWKDVDIGMSSEMLYEGPSVDEARTFKKWLDSYSRLKSCYQDFIKAEKTEGDYRFKDDYERLLHEHYTALFLQSALWHAILLMLLESVSEADRTLYKSEIDDLSKDLRKRIVIHAAG
jgi:hypothetical protein